MREPRPVIRAEVTEKNKTARIIAAAVLLLIGVIALTSAFMGLLGRDGGWQEVQITADTRNCSEDFFFQYHFSGTAATAVSRQLQGLYEEACVKAYQLFTPDEEIPGINNVYYVNHHPNEEILVDPVLYHAFEKLQGTPWLNMGPVYSYYNRILYNTEETFLGELDPALNEDARAYVAQLAQYASDPQMVKLELLGENRVKLHVSEPYLKFAQDEEFENFIDFSYMTNGFIIDYLAEQLISAGLTDGYLVSVDGYTRNLCRNDSFCFNIYDRVRGVIYPAGVLTYNGPISMVYLKNYPTAESDANYRIVEDHYVHLMADPEDGMYRTAAANLVSYSYDGGCADILLRMLPGFIGEEMLVPEDVFSLWCENGTICYNDGSVSVGGLLKSEEISYSAELRQ